MRQPAALWADVDGDGLEDRAYHLWSREHQGARLGVCTGKGVTDEIDGAGQAEGVFEVVDVQPDGRAELVFGATSVSQSLVTLAVFSDSHLHPVAVADTGDQLVLAEGPVNETTGEAWGCEHSPGHRHRHLVQVIVRHSGADAAWTRTVYRLSGNVVDRVNVEHGSGRAIETPTRQAAALVAPC